MEYTDWAALVAALAAVVVALPAIPRTPSRRYWMAGGIVLLLIAVGLAVAAARNADPQPDPSPPPTASSTLAVSPTSPHQGVSKAAYLARAEKLCGDHRSLTAAMPERASDPDGFGRWLRKITGSNQTVLDAMAAVPRPAADDDVLADLFAQRQHANQVFLRSASAFEASQSMTGEQFLNTAIDIEAAYREAAKAYGFSICVGADAPGR
jgi:hypothetical protein